MKNLALQTTTVYLWCYPLLIFSPQKPHQFGFTAAGNPKGGEAALSAMAVVANPVILNTHGSNTRILYFAVEVDGISNSALQTALRANSTFANATVTAGSYSVV